MTANEKEECLNYEEFVVVAEDEWRLHSDKRDAVTKFSSQLGGLDWWVFALTKCVFC